MDLLKTLVLYMTMLFVSSVQTMPDAQSFMVQYTTPEPTVQVTVAPEVTPSPTPVPTIAISPNPEHKTLQVGDKGEQVLRLQQALMDYGYYAGDLDGRYGNQTRYAVEHFQYNHGLVADGIAGRNTLTVLYDSNQVRYAQPTPTPSPEADTLTVAVPKVTEAPAEAIPAPQETPAETTGPAETSETDAAETAQPEATLQPEATPEVAAEPVFEAVEGWSIRFAEKEQPIALTDEEGAPQAKLYRFGDTLYVPFTAVLQEAGILAVCDNNNVEKIEIGFAVQESLYLLSFTDEKNGDPVGLEVYCNDEPLPLENRDARYADGAYYLPVETAAALTGLAFEQDEAAMELLVQLPAAE